MLKVTVNQQYLTKEEIERVLMKLVGRKFPFRFTCLRLK